MRDFLISICPVAIWCIVACEAAVAVLLLVRYIKSKQPVALLSFLLTLGLILDAALIGLGTVLPAGVLKAVSPVRFIAHGLLIPLIIPICGYALRLKKPVMIGVWAATGLLMCAGVAQAVATGNSDLIFFISMFGELLMVLFLYFYVLREDAKPTAGGKK